MTAYLERCRYGQAEGCAWLAEEVARAVGLYRLLVGIVARAAGREEAACDQLSRTTGAFATQDNVVAIRRLIKPQRVVGVVEANRRIDDRHDDRNLGAR